jgi:septin family protein
MQSIEFTTEEIEVLREVLRHKIDEADIEVFRTDMHDFKQMLKHRRDLLEEILSKISPVPVSV